MPPILVKDYTWTETEATVDITLPLREVPHKNVDILSTNSYIKVNFAPFLCEIFLYSECDEDRSRAVLNGNRLQFQLYKDQPKLWNRLTTNVTDKSVLQTLRNKAIEHFQKRQAEDVQNRSNLKTKQKNFAVEQHIKLEQEQKEKIRIAKELEKYRSLAELSKSLPPKEPKKQQVTETKVKGPPPPIRKAGTIGVNFTAREFPTAARESTKAQEEEWLKTKAETQKLLEESGPKIPVDEILSKADSLMSEKDWTSCIDFLTKSLRHYPSQVELLLARSKCNLLLGKLENVLLDASKALDIIKYSGDNKEDVRTAYSLRARAFEELDMHVEALIEWKAVAEINNTADNGDEIAEKITKLKRIIEGKTAT